MEDALPVRVRIGAFEVDLRAGELREGERNICLQEQPLFVLRMLASRPGEIVTREEIRQKLWPNDTVVDFDQGVNAAIRKLRIAFGDSADEPRYLGTIARRGYRLLAAVEPVAPKDVPAAVSVAASGAAVRQQEEPDLVGKKVSHYRVLKVIGGGGMGLIYEAEDLKLGRRVALKFLPDELAWDPTALQRFEREARAASSLDHPNICTVHEVEEYEGQPFIVMQLLEGETLRQRLSALSADGATMPLSELLDIAVQLCEGLQAAHDKGIIHRDIKPPNIFLTTTGQVKILDFGLAKLAHAAKQSGSDGAQLTLNGASAESPNFTDITVTGVGPAMGTAGYMSPEQIRGEQLDSRTDIFSFGCVLYEMATSKRAFEADTALSVEDQIVKLSPTPIREFNPALPSDLVAIVDRAMEKDRDRRYQTAADVRWALEDLQERSESAHLGSMRQRHWGRQLAAAAVLCVVVVAGWFYWRAHKAPKLTGQDTIVVADFDNKTGDAVFNDTLKQALTIQMEQSPFLHVLSADKTAETLKLMNRRAGEPLSAEVAHEVCVRSNSQALLAGSIASIGDQYLIGLRATNCQTGDTLASAEATADNRNHVLQALSKVANELREKLGESGTSVQRFNQPLEQVTTSSLEALQAYTQGKKAEDASSPDPALRYYKHAVELDPNFAIAYLALSNTYGVLYDGANESRYMTKAYELRDRVSLRERYTIEASYYNDLTAELDKEIITLTAWAQSYPDDYQPHDQLAGTYLALGQFDKAITESLISIRLRPSTGGYCGLMKAYIGANRFGDAKNAFEQALKNNFDGIALRQQRYYVAFLEGDQAGMKEQDDWTTAKPLAEAMQLSLHSSIEARRGRFVAARAIMRDAEVKASRAGAAGIVEALKVVHGPSEVDAGNTEMARQLIKEVWTKPKSTDYIATTIGLTFALLGNRSEVQGILDRINRENPLDTLAQNYTAPTIQAALELKLNNPVRAIELLQITEPYELADVPMPPNNLYPAYLRGLAYMQLGQGQQAAREFQKLIDHPGVVAIHTQGGLARLQLARAQAMSGDKAAARKSYQEFLTLWKDADPDVPIYQQAKIEYAKLQ